MDLTTRPLQMVVLLIVMKFAPLKTQLFLTVVIEDIRLAGGSTPTEGRVEILVHGSWTTIRQDGWGIMEAKVACRQLGFSANVSAVPWFHFGAGSSFIRLNGVKCTGNEDTLSNCSVGELNITSCCPEEAAGVKCLSEADNQNIRLMGGSTSDEGRVEIFIQGEWGTICDDYWDIDDANVICRQLGYGSAFAARTQGFFGAGSGRIWLDDVHCTGNEQTILDCTSQKLGTSDCNHEEDAGVKCLPETTITDIRLTGGSTSANGRVEIFAQGEWGTICDDGWDINEANVVCRQLGFKSAVDALTNAFFGEGTGQIWLDDVQCTGNETAISNCRSQTLGTHNCEHGEDASVECFSESVIEAIRLTGGSTLAEGRVEIFFQDEWGTICDDGWDINDAHVVCRQLGFESAVDAARNAFFGAGYGRIWLYGVQCTGNERTISNCTSSKLGNERCFHLEDAGVKCSVTGSAAVIEAIRLTGGSTSAEGRVEIFVQGEWGTICDDDWDINDAHVVCRQLGFESALDAPRNAFFGAGTGRIWLNGVQCTGYERTISNCTSSNLGNELCFHHEDAGVKCLVTGSAAVIEAIRLTGGSTPAEGRVEILVQGEWGTICDDGWDINDAHVVCRQLGFKSALDAPKKAFFGAGTGRIWLDGVQCTGNERTISNCSSQTLGNQNCFHLEDAGVKCLVTVKIDQIIFTRSVDPEEGMVEVSIDNVRGALCDDEHWSVANSFVVCRQLGFDSAVPLEKGSFSLHETVRILDYYFQCSGDEKKLDDCHTGIYDDNYTCNASLVYVVCLRQATGTVSNHEDTTASHSWIFIVLILLLVMVVFIYIVLKRLNLGWFAKPSNNVVNEKSVSASTQRPLPNVPLRVERNYETIDNTRLCHTVSSEKPVSESYGNKSYELMLGNVGQCVPEKRHNEELDSKYHSYAKTIIDDCAVTVDDTVSKDEHQNYISISTSCSSV